MKKFSVLGVLFILPIVAYLFFASGVNNFVRLPVLTQDVEDVRHLTTTGDSAVTFQNKISIVAFFGKDPDSFKGNTFNLDQKILKKFYEFRDFQFVILLPEEAREETEKFVEEFKGIAETHHWKFVFGTQEEIKGIFESFGTNFSLDQNLNTPQIFIIDKEKNLRGRKDDEDEGMLYGYDSRSVSELSNKMNDDVRIILAEYRLALKKNNKYREN